MKKQVHKNYIIASNIIFISIGLGILDDYLSIGNLLSREFLVDTFISLFLGVPIAYFVRRGSMVAAYILLFLTVLTLIFTYFIYSDLQKDPLITKLFYVIDLLLDVGALVLIFMAPKKAVGSEAIDDGL